MFCFSSESTCVIIFCLCFASDYCDAAVAMEACVGVDGNEDAQCEHDPESGPQTAPSEGASCSLSPLKTPVKRFLMEENSRDAFRSPRRKR